MEKGHEIKVFDHGYVKFIDQMGSDEAVIEAARMSVNKGFQNWKKDAELLEYLYANKHMTPFECGGELQIEVQAPIFIFRQWHRHRTQCLSGDTKVYIEGDYGESKEIKIKDLYNKWNNNKIEYNNILSLDENRGTFYSNSITDVVKSGKKDVFEIHLSDGKSIICSADHKFLFNNGWGSLKDKIGLIMVDDEAYYNEGKFSLIVQNLNKKIDVAEIIQIFYLGVIECYDVSVKGPNHNFVANGIVTHNSFNEMSARYTKMPDAHYLPESSRLTAQGKTNRQGSSEELLPLSIRNEFLDRMKEQQEDVYGFYEQSVKNKLSKEIARLNCPVSRYSKMRAKTDLRNWLHFLGLRMHPHAQFEIREYANAVAEIVKAFWPRTFELFEEHTLHSVTLSRTEVENLKKYITESEVPYVADEKDYVGYDSNIVEKIFKKIGFEEVK
ncbi:MAG TPA: FAD-dependent thymidylate synthase [Candidatus Glassbacteria bacterium]|nr:FAD-dependent thymidylate synthase [Candidatus Glassbacteria bacterium]